MRWTRALVTGASAGIGREMARQLAAEGTELVVVARDEARLSALAEEVGVECEVLPADLSDPAQVAAVAQRMAAADRPIDLLVNNAGFGVPGPIVDKQLDGQLAMVDVLVRAVVELSHVGVQAMVPRGNGTILNVSSGAGFIHPTGGSVYAASKAFVTRYSQGLDLELEGTGVNVTAVCPGFTRTEFQDRAGYDASDIPDFAWQSAEDVARQGLEAAHKGRPVAITGAINKALFAVVRPLPDWLQRRLVSIADR